MNRFRIVILAGIDCSFLRLPDSDVSDFFSPRRLQSAVTMTPMFPRAEYITPCLKVKLMTFDKLHSALLPRGHFTNLRKYALEPKLTAAVWGAQLHFPAALQPIEHPWHIGPGLPVLGRWSRFFSAPCFIHCVVIVFFSTPKASKTNKGETLLAEVVAASRFQVKQISWLKRNERAESILAAAQVEIYKSTATRKLHYWPLLNHCNRLRDLQRCNKKSLFIAAASRNKRWWLVGCEPRRSASITAARGLRLIFRRMCKQAS